MNRFSLLSTSLLAALGGSATAADLQPEVVVSATRVAQTIDSTLADASVVTRADIEASATRDISDLLRLQAGIDIARTGGPGGQTSVFLRGTNSNHVLVLIDGVRVSSLNTGALTWETLPLDTIERIEIVRGPRASYWGSDAIGGVVQIFTRKLDAPRVSLGYGTHGDINVNAGIGQRGENGGFSVQVGARDYEGFPSQNRNGYAYEAKDHGLENQHLTAKADTRVGTQILSASVLRSQGTTEFSGGESDFTEQAVDLALAGELAANWQHRLNVANARDDYETAAYFQAFHSRRNSLGWLNEISLSDSQRLTLGIDYLREKGENRDTFNGTPVYRESRHNTGIYAGWQARFGALDTELALRNDDNSLFGSQSTGSAAIGWRLSDTLRSYASYGQGFRGPTLNEQYSPGFGGLYAGNPDLHPEKSRSSELGIEYTPGEGQRFKGSLYSTRVNNLISFSGVDFRAENAAHAKIRGVELSYDGHFGAWQFGSNYTWQDPRNEDTDTPLLRRPRQKLSATVERTFAGNVRLGAEVLHAGERKDVYDVNLPSYTLLNLRANWKLAPAWTLGGRIENVTDRDYELARGYNTPDRTGYIELIWSAVR